MVEEDYQSDTAGAVMDRLWDFSANVENYVQGRVTSQETEKAFLDNKFANIITVSKTSDIRANFVCSDAVYGGSDAACIQAAINQAISLGGGIVHINKGHYACTDNLEYTAGNVYLEGDGPLTVLDFSAIPAETLNFISIHGAITATNSALSANAAHGTITITVADGSKFVANNWIRIRSQAVLDVYVSSYEWFQKVGEIQQIESISGNIITMKERLLGDYDTADTATVDLVTMLENISVKNITLLGPPSATVEQRGLSISQAYNVHIENVSVDDIHGRAIHIHDVVGATVNNTTVRRSNMVGLGYGLAVSNACRDITAMGNHYFNCRHGITCTGDHFYGVQYNQTYIGNTADHNDKDIVMFGMHQTYVGLTVTGNTASGNGLGFFNGRNATVTGNTAINARGWGISIPDASENTIIANNNIHTLASHCIAVRESQYGNHQIRGNTLTCDSVECDGISIANQVSNIKISDNMINVKGIGINVTTYEGISDSDTISLWNNQITCLSDEPGIQIQTVTKNISKLSIKGNKITAPSTGKCILLDGAGAGTISKIDIKNNECHGGADSIDIELGDKLTIQGNTIYDATGRGILVHSTCTGYTVTENILNNCTTPILDNGTGTKLVIRNIADCVELT